MMPNKMKLVLENGLEFHGEGFGAQIPATGEIVFNTSMVGYQEIISDPSYAGLIVLMTYPPIGQYGITDEDFEARNFGVAAMVVKECCETPSNFRYTKTLSEELEEHKIPGISGLDTRMLTHIIRENGPMRAAVVPDTVSTEEALAMIASAPEEENPLGKVSCTKRWFSRTLNHTYDVVVVDCGVKHSVIKALNELGCNVTVVPYSSTVEEVMAFNPDGVLISSGPGNPNNLPDMVSLIGNIKGRVPMVGLGLGFELIALSYGIELEKLTCGVHGGAPVRNEETGRIITVEHHYTCAIKPRELPSGGALKASYRNVVDGTIVGIECPSDKVSAVQFSPEGGPGPRESDFFEKFIKAMED